jgi:hypothetical protein
MVEPAGFQHKGVGRQPLDDNAWDETWTDLIDGKTKHTAEPSPTS